MLLLLNTFHTSLHVSESLFFSLVFLLSNVWKGSLLSHLSFTLGDPLGTLPESCLTTLGKAQRVWSVWKKAVQGHVQISAS